MSSRSSGRRGRKRRRSGGGGSPRPGADPESEAKVGPPSSTDGRSGAPRSPLSRSEQKNAAVRASLEPLEEGERPTVVTIGAIVAFLLAAGNIGLYLAGVEVGGQRPSPLSLAFPALLLVAAWGMWRARYWAVLGMQAVLALTLISVSIALIVFFASGDFLRAAAALAILTGAGLLFWHMVKAMARIQMPARR